VVTGVSRGIGPHIARALAREGVDLVVTARSGDQLRAIATELSALGGRAVAVPSDLRVAAERERLVREATVRLGGIDILVNNAALDSSGAFRTLDVETLAATIDTNLTAPIHLASLVLPEMCARRSGHIVNVASLAGKKAVPYEALYGGTKAGLIEWTSALRIELRGTGVSLSAICPGYVTGEGMFARRGVAAPKLVGSTTPTAVANAIVRAIRRNRPVVLVNSMPVRFWFALYAIAPGITERLVDLVGLTAFQRRKLESRD